MRPIETSRLALRNFSAEDSGALHAMVCQYQASKYALFDHEWPTSPDEIRKVVDWFASRDAYLAVCRKDNGEFVGFVCLNDERSGGCVRYNLGYIFDERHQGKGYATEACRAAVRHAFEDLGADLVFTGTAMENLRSCRLLERLGFRMVKRSTSALRKNADGQPAEFAAVEYVLDKADWGGPYD